MYKNAKALKPLQGYINGKQQGEKTGADCYSISKDTL